MKYKVTHLFILFILTFQLSCSSTELKLGIEKTEFYFPLLIDKNIAVVSNQTSVFNQTHLVDSLVSSRFNIKKVFSPEHGFRGKADAGAYIENGLDSKTALPIVSLYGKNKKPTTKQMESLDVIIFDIQDVGARFYTYISTLHYVMEASAENNVRLIVLDRPNPNGHYVDGPILDTVFRSFVGMHPIPIVHGMTIGEYAEMINGERWLKDELTCDLIVIEMDNYNRKQPYDLPIKPSPNLPNAKSIALYPSLCLFEGTNVSVGRGTEIPFQHYGAPYLKSNYSFTPKSKEGATNPKHQNVECFGENLTSEIVSSLELKWLISAYSNCNNKEQFFNTFFDKLAGSSRLREQIEANYTSEEIKMTWKNELSHFRKIRKKYLLYD